MFPDTLDNAIVLEYTSRKHFHQFTDYDDDDNPVLKEICYYAICCYESGQYYLFGCDEHFDVLTDDCWDTVEECKQSELLLPPDTMWYKK